MFESIELIITKLTDETLISLVLLTGTIGLIIIALWLYNRRKFHQMSHEIPADVVKNYLDSIIQNSTALKSSLFRGGGLDVQDGVPSVFSSRDLPSGPVHLNSGADSEEIAQKNAEITSLRSDLSDKQKQIQELTDKLNEMPKGESSPEEVNDLNNQIVSLKSELSQVRAELEQQKSQDGGDIGLQDKFDEILKERDELQERLQEYEIIEEDLANLKRLQQENEQLKKSLGKTGGAEPVETPEPSSAPVEPEANESVEESEDDEDLEAAMAAAIAETDDSTEESSDDESEKVVESEVQEEVNETDDEAQEKNKKSAKAEEQKSAEELLSEFEKMLG